MILGLIVDNRFSVNLQGFFRIEKEKHTSFPVYLMCRSLAQFLKLNGSKNLNIHQLGLKIICPFPRTSTLFNLGRHMSELPGQSCGKENSIVNQE